MSDSDERISETWPTGNRENDSDQGQEFLSGNDMHARSSTHLWHSSDDSPQAREDGRLPPSHTQTDQLTLQQHSQDVGDSGAINPLPPSYTSSGGVGSLSARDVTSSRRNLVDGMSTLSLDGLSSRGTSSMALEAQVREYNRLHAQHQAVEMLNPASATSPDYVSLGGSSSPALEAQARGHDRLQAQDQHGHRSQTQYPTSRTAGFDDGIWSLPPLARDAQIREYNRLHRAHIENTQRRNNQTGSMVGGTVGSWPPSSTNAPVDGSSTRNAGSEHFTQLVDDLTHQLAIGSDSMIREQSATDDDLTIGSDDSIREQSATADGRGLARSEGEGASMVPLDQPGPREYYIAVIGRTDYHTKPVMCIHCNSQLYTVASAADILCQICSRISSVAEDFRGRR